MYSSTSAAEVRSARRASATTSISARRLAARSQPPPAAEIAYEAVGIVDAGDDAERGKVCLARRRQNFNIRAADALGLGDEVGAVLGVATGGSGDGEDAPDLLDATQRPESSQRRQRLGHRV